MKELRQGGETEGEERMVVFFVLFFIYLFFFFKQKTAYEIVDCDWSSDVCSSDLNIPGHGHQQITHQGKESIWYSGYDRLVHFRKDQNICEEYPIGYYFRKFVFLNPNEIALDRKSVV